MAEANSSTPVEHPDYALLERISDACHTIETALNMAGINIEQKKRSEAELSERDEAFISLRGFVQKQVEEIRTSKCRLSALIGLLRPSMADISAAISIADLIGAVEGPLEDGDLEPGTINRAARDIQRKLQDANACLEALWEAK